MTTTPSTHEEWLVKASQFYETHTIKPFHIIDIKPFYKDDEEEGELVCICLFNLFGTFDNVTVTEKDRPLIPYLLVASGILPKSSPGALFCHHDKSFFSIYMKKRGERDVWLSTQFVSLDKIDMMAKEHRSSLDSVEFFESMIRDQKHQIKRHKNRHIQRWDPYIERVRALDPTPRDNIMIAESLTPPPPPPSNLLDNISNRLLTTLATTRPTGRTNVLIDHMLELEKEGGVRLGQIYELLEPKIKQSGLIGDEWLESARKYIYGWLDVELKDLLNGTQPLDVVIQQRKQLYEKKDDYDLSFVICMRLAKTEVQKKE